MPIVVDSNVLIVLVSGDPRKNTAENHFRQWILAGEAIHAPALLLYEVANGLTRLIAAGLFPSELVAEAWRTILSLPITYHQLESFGDNVVTMALGSVARARTMLPIWILPYDSERNCGHLMDRSPGTPAVGAFLFRCWSRTYALGTSHTFSNQ